MTLKIETGGSISQSNNLKQQSPAKKFGHRKISWISPMKVLKVALFAGLMLFNPAAEAYSLSPWQKVKAFFNPQPYENSPLLDKIAARYQNLEKVLCDKSRESAFYSPLSLEEGYRLSLKNKIEVVKCYNGDEYISNFGENSVFYIGEKENKWNKKYGKLYQVDTSKGEIQLIYKGLFKNGLKHGGGQEYLDGRLHYWGHFEEGRKYDLGMEFSPQNELAYFTRNGIKTQRGFQLKKDRYQFLTEEASRSWGVTYHYLKKDDYYHLGEVDIIEGSIAPEDNSNRLE